MVVPGMQWKHVNFLSAKPSFLHADAVSGGCCFTLDAAVRSCMLQANPCRRREPWMKGRVVIDWMYVLESTIQVKREMPRVPWLTEILHYPRKLYLVFRSKGCATISSSMIVHSTSSISFLGLRMYFLVIELGVSFLGLKKRKESHWGGSQ
jgi:hypothetical protein